MVEGPIKQAASPRYTVNRAWLSWNYKMTNINLLFVFKDFKFLKKELLVQEIIYIFSFWKEVILILHYYPNKN
jgi:hypothetical protein